MPLPIRGQDDVRDAIADLLAYLLSIGLNDE